MHRRSLAKGSALLRGAGGSFGDVWGADAARGALPAKCVGRGIDAGRTSTMYVGRGILDAPLQCREMAYFPMNWMVRRFWIAGSREYLPAARQGCRALRTGTEVRAGKRGERGRWCIASIWGLREVAGAFRRRVRDAAPYERERKCRWETACKTGRILLQ